MAWLPKNEEMLPPTLLLVTPDINDRPLGPPGGAVGAVVVDVVVFIWKQ